MSNLSLARVTLMDFVLVAGFAILGVYLVGSGRASTPGARVELRNARGKTLTFAVGEERIVRVDGLRGTTVVGIHDGYVQFLASPCPHKVCIRRGRISRSGEWIACIPNGVIAVITGERDYDDITP